MIISNKHKFIFLKSSRVSGTTLLFILSTQCEEEDLFSFNSNFNKIKKKTKKNFNIKNPNFFVTNLFFLPRFILKSNSSFLLKKLSSFYIKYLKSEHIEAKKVKKLLNKSDFKKYFKFTIVRNPYDQFESYFYHSKSIDFKNFCKRNAVKFFSKEKKIISINNKIVADKVLKYEDGFKNLILITIFQIFIRIIKLTLAIKDLIKIYMMTKLRILFLILQSFFLINLDIKND